MIVIIIMVVVIIVGIIVVVVGTALVATFVERTRELSLMEGEER